jgi:ubiquinone/menaquinone biosynthesis C-methylase UbiE
MTTFTREDGCEIAVVPGFRERALAFQTQTTPRGHWTDDDFAKAVAKRLERSNRLMAQIARQYGPIDKADVLEIGCGDGLNSLLLGLRGVRRAVGIDIDFRLDKKDEQGQRTRRMVADIIKASGSDKSLDQCLSTLPVEFVSMDATAMEFPDNSFDLILSRSVLEHIRPIERLIAETARVIRPGGMAYHEIDPFYWLRGCHKRGLVDIPWAHARLTMADFHRFVAETEGVPTADKRLLRLKTLNRLTLRDWKALMENSAFEIVEWVELEAPFAVEVLGEYREAPSTLLHGATSNDLVVSRVHVWLRKRSG